tara:strand:- start:17 stop:163 length:147 start_codon:yes stop_codon:yes gene_type:complete
MTNIKNVSRTGILAKKRGFSAGILFLFPAGIIPGRKRALKQVLSQTLA